MSLISGYQKIKKMIKTANGYQLLSFWTSSDTVEMKDGTTLEDRICNVDNTADQDKPISTAQQNALNQKADLVSPALNGTPTAPTPPTGTNTAQIATTEFVQTAVNNATDGIITEIKSEDSYMICDRSGSAVTITHKDASQTDTSSTAKPSAGGTFTAVKSVSSDTKGHVTGIETETITLPSLDATGFGLVSTKASQGLSDTEQANARANIGAVSKTGDTMTGSLIVNGPANAGISAISANQPQIIVDRKDANGNRVRAGMLQVSSSNNFGLYDLDSNKWMCVSDKDGNTTFNGNSTSATSVKSTITNPTSNTGHYVPFVSGNSTGNKPLLQNNGFGMNTQEGTASTPGFNILTLGNNVQSGTPGNKYGQITLWGEKKFANVFKTGNLTANRVISTPDKTGTIALTSDLSGYLPKTGGTINGNISINGNFYGGNLRIQQFTGDGYSSYIGGGGLTDNVPNYPGFQYKQYSTHGYLYPCFNSAGDSTSLGSTDRKFKAVYATNVYNSSGVITSSDRKKKKDFEEITQTFADNIIDGLIPTSFLYKDGTSGRRHYALIAQDVENLLKKLGIDIKDFAPLIKDYPTKVIPSENEEEPDTIVTDYDADPEYHLRYEGFVGLIIKYIQGLKEKVNDLEERMETSDKKNADLEKRIETLENLIKQ